MEEGAKKAAAAAPSSPEYNKNLDNYGLPKPDETANGEDIII